MWGIGEKTAADLIQMVERSELGLPQFQRPSVWGRANWTPFLLTILLGRPTGTLLLMETEGESVLSPRSLDNAPPLVEGQLKWLLLDGQQRTTTLYSAARAWFLQGRGNNRRRAIVSVASALQRGELTEDDIAFVPENQITDAARMAISGTVAFSTLLDDDQLEMWRFAYTTAHFDGDAPQFRAAIEYIAPGLLKVSEYRFPVLKLQKDTPVNVVAEIFEGMNRQGLQLNKFDLMVARLYRKLPDGTFYDLRERWERSLGSAEYLRQIGINVDDGLLPLQLIAKQVARCGDPDRGRVRGITSASVLELDEKQVIGLPGALRADINFEIAVNALENAAKFLVGTCGVVGPSLLPQKAMLLPLADRFIQGSAGRLPANQLKKWFFATGLANPTRYYGSVNSYAEQDFKFLEDWADPGQNSLPPVVTSLDREAVMRLDLKQRCAREGDILGKTVFALLVANGAMDWAEGQLSLQGESEVDLHHVIPNHRLRDWYSNRESRAPIAGLTPIRAATNRAIGNENPRLIMEERFPDDSVAVMGSHRIDPGLLSQAYENLDSFEVFLEDREKRLKEFIIQALGL